MENLKEIERIKNEIEAIDKKCRKETIPYRQRNLFLQMKKLKSQLNALVGEKSMDENKEVATESNLSPMLKQFLDLKKKHPDALLLFRCGDFYETYKDDAEKASKVLGITLTKSTKTKDDEGKPLAMAGFPYHALDTYLPKLIRAGHRVAICDQIEAPKKVLKRRGSNELASIALAFIVAFSSFFASCSDDEFVQETEVTQTELCAPAFENVNDSLFLQQGREIGWRIINASSNVHDLSLPDSIVDALDENNDDITCIINYIEGLSKQPIFGDTIAECEVWDEWCAWFSEFSRRYEND